MESPDTVAQELTPMTRIVLFVLALVFMTTADRAVAQLPTQDVNDGNALLRECGAALRSPRGREPCCRIASAAKRRERSHWP